MEKKSYLAILLAVLSVGLGMAQAQNQECMTNLSIYFEHAKVKNYDAAYEPWKMVYATCPDINKANFSVGERILKHKIKNSSGADKDGYVQDLLALYDDANKHFPTKFPKGDVGVDKILLGWKQKMLSDEQIYSGLDNIFKTDRKNFKNPQALYLYYSTLVDLYKGGSKDLQLVFDTYDDVTEKIQEENRKLTRIIQTLLPKDSLGTMNRKEKSRFKAANTNSVSYGKIEESIDAKTGGLGDCSDMVPLYQKNFASKKGDIKWVKRAVGRMFRKECTDDPLFRELFQAQLALEPSADAYFYEGVLSQKAGDNAGAIQSFNKAVELESDKSRKAEIQYKIATIMKRRGQRSQARTYARRALRNDPSIGKAHLLIASLYQASANTCGNTTFEKRAIYWLAAQEARKAGRVDPSLRSRANKSASSYEQRAPSRTDIFNEGMAGKSVSFSGCWVGGSVKVPNL